MASPADAKLPNASGKENAEGANVDKIRDILFGSQMRDYEKRFMRLEDTVTKAIETLREDMTKRFDTLSNYMKEEVDSLSQRVKAEKSERSEGLKEVSREIKDGAKVIEKKLSQLEEQMSDGHGELRSKLLEHSKSMAAEIDKLRRDTTAALNREVDVLRDEKTDRAGLADLFNEFSLRLKNKFELPEE
jgi:DNA repair exonuclease SbcCD ATPase subunit